MRPTPQQMQRPRPWPNPQQRPWRTPRPGTPFLPTARFFPPSTHSHHPLARSGLISKTHRFSNMTQQLFVKTFSPNGVTAAHAAANLPHGVPHPLHHPGHDPAHLAHGLLHPAHPLPHPLPHHPPLPRQIPSHDIITQANKSQKCFH